MTTATPETASIVKDNWQRVQSDVEQACTTAGRNINDVRIVGVSKYVDAALTMQLVEAGCTVLGENRPQVLWEKWKWFDEQDNAPSNVTWHMIGHFQRNKVRRTLPRIALLESLDNLRLAEVVNAEAQKLEITLPVLIDVNVTQDSSKTGLPASELPSFIEQAQSLPAIKIRGLMAMSSLHSESHVAREEFAKVRQLRDDMLTRFGDSIELPELSMGMSGDFREAIAEGATMVRIGSNLWRGIIG